VRKWAEKTEIAVEFFIRNIGVARSKFYQWRDRYGRVNEHNSWIPRDHWILEHERDAIVQFFVEHPLDGYRRLAFMMIDADVVAVSPSTVYRVLAGKGLLANRFNKPTRKGSGFEQPLAVHEHWHIDISHINIGGTFYYLCSVLDGASRFIVYHDLRQSMTEPDIELILQRARERFPGVTPRIISDNGPQFVAKDFKEFIRLAGMTHVRTSPYYPQSNGKIERWHQSIKVEGIRLADIHDYPHACKVINAYVEYYNNTRLNSAIGYIAPTDKLAGREKEIFEQRDRKLELARANRALTRQAAA
jgi:transposase InsO family protein